MEKTRGQKSRATVPLNHINRKGFRIKHVEQLLLIKNRRSSWKMCFKKTSEVLILTRTFFLNKKIVKNAGRKASHTQMLFVVGSLAGTEKQLIQEQETFGDLLQINLPGIGTCYLVFRI
jgi:hypothetical protein